MQNSVVQAKQIVLNPDMAGEQGRDEREGGRNDGRESLSQMSIGDIEFLGAMSAYGTG